MQRLEKDRCNVLVVDDNVTNLKVATEHLKAAGYQVLTARDGESAIERAGLAQPDLILLDVQMGGIDGFETCRRLKSDEATVNIPVIFMTVLTNVEDKLKGFEAGGVDYVPKPFQVEELLARVNTHLTLYRLQKQLKEEIAERKAKEAALRKANLELERLAVIDGLTQIANRRRFDEYLQNQWTPAVDAPLSLLICDVDFFKRFNDGYGHQAGDQCLHKVAQGISAAVNREQDLAARYGGEEFAVILPETDLEGAKYLAEKIQESVRNLKIFHAFSDVNPYVTLSIGAACIYPLQEPDSGKLVAAADAALYEAKRTGRNRVMTSP